MDTSFRDISFNAEGICNYCTEFTETTAFIREPEETRKKQLESLISNVKLKGKGRAYDCVVGISGGVDSCYTAHLCLEYGLKPLLVHMDNGWNTEISVNNIRKMIDALGFDYISVVLDWDEFREIQLAFLKSSIVDLEMPTDIAIAACLNQTAAKHKIKFILSGGNYSGEGILPLQMGYHRYKDMKLYRHIVRKYSTVKLRTIPTMGLVKEMYFKYVKGIKTAYPLNYVNYDKDQARNVLIQQYQWQNYGGKHHESRITAFWQSYAMPVKYNMDYRRTTLASQIITGQVSRSDALKQLEQPAFDAEKITDDKKYIAKKFGISESELESYLNNPPRTFVDFPNNEKFIRFVHNTYRRIFKK
jgi:N-acetyl sugar amidotransferase